MSGTAPFRASKPKNKSAKPIRNSESALYLLLDENIRGSPNAIIGNARTSILILNPRIVIIHAVMVVPMLAPIITPID